MPHCSCHEYLTEAANEKADNGLRCLKAPSLPSIGISEVLATKLALDSLEDTVCPRLKLPRSSCPIHGLRYLPFSLFHALDLAFFRGVLKHQVLLRWSNILPSGVHGLTCKPGTRDTRITIDLQPQLIRASSAEGLLAVLIHHMAHAYFLACCGPPRDERKQHPGHDLAYCTLVYRIMDCFRLHGSIRLPSPFLFDPTKPPVTLHRQLRRQDGSLLSKTEPGKCCMYQMPDFLRRNTCLDHVLTLKELSLGRGRNSDLGDPYPKSHYLHVVNLQENSFNPVLRAQYPSPPSDYIELHYESYAVPFDRSKLRGNCSLASKLDQEVHFLNVPAPSDHIFFTFYLYLLNGDYPPEVVLASCPYFRATKTQGPPTISAYNPEMENYLMTDIKMFSLASMLDFSDLRDSAIDRVYSLNETHANPIAMLEELYNSPTRSDEDRDRLRRWVQDFLAKSDGRSTNLDVLQSELWAEKLSILRGGNGLFNMDYETAFGNLVMKKAMAGIRAGSGGDKKKSTDQEKPGKDDHEEKDLSPSEREFLRQMNPDILKLYEEIRPRPESGAQKADESKAPKEKKPKEQQQQQHEQHCTCQGIHQAGQTVGVAPQMCACAFCNPQFPNGPQVIQAQVPGSPHVMAPNAPFIITSNPVNFPFVPCPTHHHYAL